MTSSSDEQTGTSGRGIDDDQLPDDLQPGEDNPLAEPLDDDVDPDDLDVLDGGKGAEQWDDEQLED